LLGNVGPAAVFSCGFSSSSVCSGLGCGSAVGVGVVGCGVSGA
jgi:hypothetical protein